MAITTEVVTLITNKPDSFTESSATITFSSYNQSTHEATIAAASNTHASNNATGLTTLKASFKTWLDGTYVSTNLGLNSSDTINGIAYIRSITRENSDFTDLSGKDIFLTGTDQFKIGFDFRWEKTA